MVNAEGRLELADLDVPRIGEREILVRMRVCGICGTDLAKLHGMRVTPLVLGHEVVGDIEQVGPGLKTYSRGDRVAVHHHVPCHTCFYCTHGDHTMCPEFPRSNLDPCGFAEYFRAPRTNVDKGAVFQIPSNMSYEEAAFAEPTGCCIRALNRLGVRPDDTFLVIGAGPAGLTHIQLLGALGVRTIFATDIVDFRLEWASKFGASAAMDATRSDLRATILDATMGRGVDKVIVASGSSKAIESSLNLVRKGGRVLLFGVPPGGSYLNCDASQIFIRETKLVPSYSTTEEEMKTALEMMASKKIQLTEMISHRFALTDITEAFHAAEDASSSLKVMVHS